ncbi:CHAT domain-containing protein [Streptomyces sp. NPDC096132]|uniref:CHAT domain-containing tetratricopeptide repeat protein n=1 Tax=Streptomyces sp. NPDC096132 TaxID=3366075 RepID=UPI0038232775
MDDEAEVGESAEYVHVLTRCYCDDGDEGALDEALHLAGRLDPFVITDPVRRATALRWIGLALQYDYERSGDLDSLERSVRALRQAAEAVQDRDDHGAYLINLCNALRQLDEESQGPGPGEEAVEVGRLAVAATAGSHDRPAAANNLALALWARYDRTDDAALLREATGLLREAVEAAPHEDEHRVRHLGNLGLVLREQYVAFGDKKVLEEAVAELRRAVETAGPDHPDASDLTGNLGIALQDLAERTGDRATLREAVALLRRVADAGDPGDPDHGRNLSNLSAALQDWYEMVSDTAALRESVERARRAVAVTPDGHPHLPARLSHLGLALRMSYENTGALANLREAVAVSRRAVEEADVAYPRLGVYLSNLGSALRFLYEHTGSVASLEEAIEMTRRAVEVTPGDRYQRAAYQSNLVLALWTRYERNADLDTLKEAVDAGRSALALTDPDSPDHHRYATNVGLALWTLHDREPESAALDEAVEIMRDVYHRTESDHAEYARFASNLSNALRARHLRGGLPADLDEALTVGRAALEHTKARQGHVDHAKHLSNVGALLIDRYRRRKRPEDLDEALPLLREAVTTTPPDHLDHALYSFNLGEACQLRALRGLRSAGGAPTTELSPARNERLADEASADEALTHLRAAAGAPQAPPSLRVEAAWTAGGLYAARRDWPQCLEQLATAVELLARVTPRHLTLRDRGHGLTRFLGLVSDAAAAALHCGENDRALLLLEEGRGILLDQALDRDDDLVRLRAQAPELAERFASLRELLDTRVPGPAEQPDPEPERGPRFGPAHPRDRRHAAAAEWDELVARIREVPGLDRFLRPPPLADLLAAAPTGVVVTVNCSDYRCDALVVAAEGVRPVALPKLSVPDLLARSRALQDALTEVTETAGRARRAAERRFGTKFTTLSQWLWSAVVEPVMQTIAPSVGPYRVWWSPTGPLTSLPLHAAGRDAPGDLLDIAVSSYTPTVRALRAVTTATPHLARSPAADHPRALEPDEASRDGDAPGPGDVLAVPADSVLLVDAAPDLDAARRETREVAALLGTPPPLSGGSATREAVRSALTGCTVAHLAVHAVGDPADPSLSHLTLVDGPLTLLDVMELRPERPWLAYLSACDTAEPGTALADEALHLAAAFQAVGFPHVVATLWPAEDGTAAELARSFYSYGVPAEPAHALRRAARALRDEHRDQPLRWVPYLHMGA